MIKTEWSDKDKEFRHRALPEKRQYNKRQQIRGILIKRKPVQVTGTQKFKAGKRIHRKLTQLAQSHEAALSQIEKDIALFVPTIARWQVTKRVSVVNGRIVGEWEYKPMEDRPMD